MRHFNVGLPNALYLRLYDYCKSQNKTKLSVVRIALNQFLAFACPHCGCSKMQCDVYHESKRGIKCCPDCSHGRIVSDKKHYSPKHTFDSSDLETAE